MTKFSIKSCSYCGRQFQNELEFFKDTSRWRICSQQNLWFNCQCDSTLILLKGQYSWYSPEKHLGKETASIFTKFGDWQQLPRIPTKAMQAIEHLNDPEATSESMARLLKGDPFLAKATLQAANQKSEQPIKDLPHAVTFIGLGKLQDILTLPIVQSFSIAAKEFDVDAFWEFSACTAWSAERLARDLLPKGEGAPDNAYLAGYLLNIGQLVMAMILPEQADFTYGQSAVAPKLKNWHLVEKENKFDIYHTSLGEIATTLWGFPSWVSEACARHHSIAKLEAMPDLLFNKEMINTITIASFSPQVAHCVMGNPYRMNRQMCEYLCRQFNFTESEFEKLIERYAPQYETFLGNHRIAS